MVYGVVLDVIMAVIAQFSYNDIAYRLVFYLIGLVACSLGVALLFNIYLPSKAYEMFVKELSQKYTVPIEKIKTIYDCCSCVISIILSFIFFGFGIFVGVKLGTVGCALINGWLIGRISCFLENNFVFKDALQLRKN